MTITDDILNDIEAKARAATPGPWQVAGVTLPGIMVFPLGAVRKYGVIVEDRRDHASDALASFVRLNYEYIAELNPARALELITALREARAAHAIEVERCVALGNEIEALRTDLETLSASRQSILDENEQLRAERDGMRAVVKAAQVHLATHPVFRSKPVGFMNSQARLQQVDQIESEDALRAALSALGSKENAG